MRDRNGEAVSQAERERRCGFKQKCNPPKGGSQHLGLFVCALILLVEGPALALTVDREGLVHYSFLQTHHGYCCF